MFDAASEVRKTALRKTHVDIVVGAIGSVRLAHFKIPQQLRGGTKTTVSGSSGG
jgi:hypothetical protein